MTLKEYIAAYDVQVSVIARKTGLSRMMIYNYIKGESTPTIKVALRIEEFTGGEVTLYDWAHGESALAGLL